MATTVFQMGIDAKIILDALSKLEVGELLTYQQMSALIGRDVRQHRHIMAAARKGLMRDSKVFAPVENQGLQRLTDAQKVQVAGDQLRRITRITKKIRATLAAVADFDKLPNDLMVQHNATMSLCGAIGQMSAASSMRKVEQVLQYGNRQVLPIAETLKFFAA